MNNQKYPDSFVRAAETEAATPVIPLPNPGEGGPVDMGGENASEENTPVIPLPNPGEGGPAYNPPGNNNQGGGHGGGNNANTGRPNMPIFRPVFPGTGGSGSNIGNVSGGVTVIPGVTFPCFNCTSTSFGRVRILNAATGYQPFYVYLGNWMIASQLGNGDMTSYVQSASGSQTITVSGANGYVYIQKAIQVRSSSAVTVAIINTASGLDLLEISDISCNAPSGSSCLRACNLSLNAGPFDITVETQNSSYPAFSNVRYKEVTPYTSFYPGWYQIYISRTGSYPGTAIATAAANMSANTSYTLYIFDAPSSTEGLRTMVVSN